MHIGATLSALAITMPLAACAESPPRSGAPYHHTAEGFRNPPGSPGRMESDERGSWVFKRMIGGFPKGEMPPGHLVPPAEARAALAALEGRDSVTWIGHMTALLRLGGKWVLTDPWFSKRASPFSFAGPKRFAPPGLAIADLPPIDVVVLSHNHYDHLDIDSISALPNRERITAVVPLGLGHYFSERGYGRVVELDWYERAEAAGLTVTALPAIHWSNRLFVERNSTLWAAFAIESPEGTRVYFGGDSEYGPVFSEVGRRFGPFDVALLSVGAYLPRFVMRGSHCVPADCVQLGLDVGAETLVAMHWGTIRLGDDDVEEGIGEFVAAARTAGLSEKRVWRMRIGETREIARRADAQAAQPALASDGTSP